jgi:pyruvate/2-oxoglutarate dehydrogenase complex dihydrolipoamide dehydrogenase (E3) component
MQAAILASERGHDVTLYEKSEKLGGQLVYADHVEFKKDMKKYREYLIRQVNQSKVKVKLNTTATPELIRIEMPDAVIVALGADPIIPPIPGVDNSNVITAIDAYSNTDRIGQKVAVIGGGMVGCETALHLAQLGREVVLVEMGDMLAPDGVYSERMHTIHFMDQLLKYHVNTKCTKITDKGIQVIDENSNEQFIEADTIVLSTGMKARAEERDTFKGVAFDVIPVGDCVNAGPLINATRTGYNAALRL